MHRTKMLDLSSTISRFPVEAIIAFAIRSKNYPFAIESPNWLYVSPITED